MDHLAVVTATLLIGGLSIPIGLLRAALGRVRPLRGDRAALIVRWAFKKSERPAAGDVVDA